MPPQKTTVKSERYNSSITRMYQDRITKLVQFPARELNPRFVSVRIVPEAEVTNKDKLSISGSKLSFPASATCRRAGNMRRRWRAELG